MNIIEVLIQLERGWHLSQKEVKYGLKIVRKYEKDLSKLLKVKGGK